MEGREAHRQQMLAYWERDRLNAKKYEHILGIKITPRHDVSCPRKGEFCGVFLPDEAPALYPRDCPSPDYCCCVNREFVLDGDPTPEAEMLRRKSSNPPSDPPPPPLVTTVGKLLEEPTPPGYSYEEIRVIKHAIKEREFFGWDEHGYYTDRLGYPATELLERMLKDGLVEHAALTDRLIKLTTVAQLREVCKEFNLPRSGDKRMLIDRVVSAAPERARQMTGENVLLRVTNPGRNRLRELDGAAQAQAIYQDMRMRTEAYQRLLRYASATHGAKIVIAANSWSSCPKLVEIVGVYAPTNAPILPCGDCPNTGVKPCSCWNAYVEINPEQSNETQVSPGQWSDIEPTGKNIQRPETAPRKEHWTDDAPKIAMIIFAIFIVIVIAKCSG